MKYSFKNGSIVCKETGETVPSLSGTVAGIRVVNSDSGLELVQIDLKAEGETPEVNTLIVKKYGDASLKIVRCLYGIVEILAGKVITVTTEAREGKSSLIVVLADGEVLSPVGYVEPYSYERRTLTDKILGSLIRSLTYRRDVLVAVFDGEGAGVQGAEDVAALIRDLRRSGREDSLKVVKYGFTDERSAAAYLKGIKDAKAFADIHVFANDTEDIDLVWEAFTEPLPQEDPVPAGIDSDIEVEC